MKCSHFKRQNSTEQAMACQHCKVDIDNQIKRISGEQTGTTWFTFHWLNNRHSDSRGGREPGVYHSITLGYTTKHGLVFLHRNLHYHCSFKFLQLSHERSSSTSVFPFTALIYSSLGVPSLMALSAAPSSAGVSCSHHKENSQAGH